MRLIRIERKVFTRYLKPAGAGLAAGAAVDHPGIQEARPLIKDV